MGRILKGIFIVLIVVIIAEISYYIYYQFRLEQQTNLTINDSDREFKNIVGNLNIRPSAFPSPNPAVSALNPIVLYSLFYLKKDVTLSSILTSKFSGQLVDLDTKGGIAPARQFKYKLMVKLAEGKSDFVSYINEYGLSKTTIYKTINSKEVLGSIDDLIVNDKIIMEQAIDLTKDINSNIINIKITKL